MARAWISRGIAQRAAAAAVGTAAAFILLELGLRIVIAMDPDPTRGLEKAGQITPLPTTGDCKAPGAAASLAHIVKPSSLEGLVYELKPNTVACYRGARHTANSDGQRARSFEPFQRPKPKNAFRVLLLGDSWAYAQSVEYAGSFGAELERLLQRHFADKRVEVINAGVPGYNAAQEAAYLEARGMSYGPDCIVILFVSNDLGLPYLMLEPRDPLTVRRSYVLEKLAGLIDRDPEAPTVPPGMTSATGPLGNFVGADQLDRVPERYRYMVGVGGYKRALEAIRATAKGVPVINVADYSDVVGFQAEHRAEMVRFQQKLGIHHAFVPILRDPALWVAPDDAHPNARGHAAMARQTLQFLERQRLCVPPATNP